MERVTNTGIIIDELRHNCSKVALSKDVPIFGQFSFDLKTSHVESSKSNKAKQKGDLSLITNCFKSSGNAENLYPETVMIIERSNSIWIMAGLHD
jgi:hypothetical protein